MKPCFLPSLRNPLSDGKRQQSTFESTPCGRRHDEKRFVNADTGQFQRYIYYLVVSLLNVAMCTVGT